MRISNIKPRDGFDLTYRKLIRTFSVDDKNRRLLTEFRNIGSTASGILADKMIDFIISHYQKDYIITNEIKHFVVSIDSDLNLESITNEKSDGKINVFLVETPKKEVSGKFNVLTNEMIIYIDNEILPFINHVKNGKNDRSDKSIFKDERVDFIATFRHELEHAIAKKENSFMNLVKKKIGNNKTNFISENYIDLWNNIKKRKFKCFSTDHNSVSFLQMQNRHSIMLLDYEISSYIVDIKIEAEKSNKLDKVFDILSKRVIYDDFTCYELDANDVNQLMQLTILLNRLVLEIYVKVFLLKYPDTKKSLENHVFDVIGTKFVYNFKTEKLELVEADK